MSAITSAAASADRFDATSDLFRAANVLGLRVVAATPGNYLPPGTSVICRSWAAEPLAFVWPDGTMSVAAAASGSVTDWGTGVPTFVIEPTDIGAYLRAIAAKSLNGWPNRAVRTAVLFGLRHAPSTSTPGIGHRAYRAHQPAAPVDPPAAELAELGAGDEDLVQDGAVDVRGADTVDP